MLYRPLNFGGILKIEFGIWAAYSESKSANTHRRKNTYQNELYALRERERELWTDYLCVVHKGDDKN